MTHTLDLDTTADFDMQDPSLEELLKTPVPSPARHKSPTFRESPKHQRSTYTSPSSLFRRKPSQPWAPIMTSETRQALTAQERIPAYLLYAFFGGIVAVVLIVLWMRPSVLMKPDPDPDKDQRFDFAPTAFAVLLGGALIAGGAWMWMSYKARKYV